MQKSKSLLIKVLTFICSVCCVLALAFGLVACSDGADGRGIKSATINSDGELVITYTDDTTDNLGKVVGNDGAAGSQGIQGVQGNPGTDGVTPTIGTNGNWYIGETDTGVKAEGTDGETPTVTINSDGYWVINGEPTTVKAVGTDGDNGASIASITSYTKDGKVYLVITLTDDTVKEVPIDLTGVVAGGCTCEPGSDCTCEPGTGGCTCDPEVCPNDDEGEHDYITVATIGEATCTEGGYYVKVCKNNCGSAITVKFNATGHDYVKSVTTETTGKPDYCGSDYVVTTTTDYVCSVCGEHKEGYPQVETVTTPAPEHSWAIQYQVDENGEYVLDEDGKAIPVLDEDGNVVYQISDMPYLDEEGQPLNVCEYGYQSGNVCTVCGAVRWLEHHPAKGHTVNEDWVKASEVPESAENYDATKTNPTLEDAGYIYGHCDVCDKYVYVEIPAFTTDGLYNETGANIVSDGVHGYTIKVTTPKTSCSIVGVCEYTWTYYDEDGEVIIAFTYEAKDEATEHYIILDGVNVYLHSASAANDEHWYEDDEEYLKNLIANNRLAICEYDTETKKYVYTLATEYVEGEQYYYVYSISEYPDNLKYFTDEDKTASCTDVIYGWFECANCKVINSNKGVTPVLFMGTHVEPTDDEATELELTKLSTDLIAALTESDTYGCVYNKVEFMAAVAQAIKTDYDAGTLTLEKGKYYTIAADNDTAGVTFYVCEKCGYVVVTDAVPCIGHEYVYTLYTLVEFEEAYGSNETAQKLFEASVAERVDKDSTFEAEYALVITDNKDADYLNVLALRESDLVRGEIIQVATCVTEGKQNAYYLYDGAYRGPVTLSIPKTDHGVVIDGVTYYIFDKNDDLSKYVDSNGELKTSVDEEGNTIVDLWEAYPKYLNKINGVEYFAGVVDITGNGDYRAVYYYTEELLLWFTTSGTSCADDGYDEGYFFCALVDVDGNPISHNEVGTTNNVTPIYVRGNHTYGEVVVIDTTTEEGLEAYNALLSGEGTGPSDEAFWNLKDGDAYQIYSGCESDTYIVKKCSVCGKFVYSLVTESGAHTPDEADITVDPIPTATTDGYAEIVIDCKVCGENIVNVTVTLGAYGELAVGEKDLGNGVSVKVELLRAATCLLTGKYRVTYYYTYTNGDDKNTIMVYSLTYYTDTAEHVISDVESTWIVCDEEGLIWTYYGHQCKNCGSLVPYKKVLVENDDVPVDVAAWLNSGNAIDIDLRPEVTSDIYVSLPAYENYVWPVGEAYVLSIAEDGYYKISVYGKLATVTVSLPDYASVYVYGSSNASYNDGTTSTVVYLEKGEYGVTCEGGYYWTSATDNNYEKGDATSYTVIVEKTEAPEAPEFDFEQDLVIGLNENLTSGSTAKYYFQVSESGTYKFTVSGDHSGVYLNMPLTEDDVNYVTGGYDTENDVTFTAEIEAGVWYYISIFSSDWAQDGVCNLTIELVN